MKRLLDVNDIAERYRCSPKTARRYMKQMEHMVKPLRVTELAVESWEADRTREAPQSYINRQSKAIKKTRQTSVIYISRVREAK